MPIDPQEFQRFLERGQARFQACQTLLDPHRYKELEDFRQNLEIWCGEDPVIFCPLGRRIKGRDELGPSSLVDDLAVFLQVQHAFLYQHKPDGAFERIASFGRPAGIIQPRGPLIQWLSERRMPLVRSQLTVGELSLEETQALLGELDQLGASVVVPVSQWVATELKGLLIVGPPLVGDYGQEEALRLRRYGNAIARCLADREQGRPTLAQALAEREAAARKTLADWWGAFGPSRPLQCLIVDEELEVAEYIGTLFGLWGCQARSFNQQNEALKALEHFSPDLALVDLSLYRQMPLALLKALASRFSQALVFGTTTGCTDTDESVAMELGVRRIFRKACRMEPMVDEMLETFLTHRLDGPLLSRP